MFYSSKVIITPSLHCLQSAHCQPYGICAVAALWQSWWTKVEQKKSLWGRSPASIAVPVCQHGRVPEVDPSLSPMQRVYLRGGKLRYWACSLEPKPYRSLQNSLTGWPDLHSNNGGGSFAAGRARLSLSLTCRFRNSSRRFMWIGFSRLLIMTEHVRDTPGRVRTRRTMRGSR